VLANVERSYSGKTLSVREEVPQGQLARDAFVTLFMRGSLFKGTLAVTRERLELMALWAGLTSSGVTLELYSDARPPAAVLPLEQWVTERVALLGVESGDDLQMLSAKDFTPPDVPQDVRAQLEKHFPHSVRVGDVMFNAEYSPASAQVILRPAKGGRVELPPTSFFPKFGGMRVVVEMAGVQKVVRPRA